MHFTRVFDENPKKGPKKWSKRGHFRGPGTPKWPFFGPFLGQKWAHFGPPFLARLPFTGAILALFGVKKGPQKVVKIGPISRSPPKWSKNGGFGPLSFFGRFWDLFLEHTYLILHDLGPKSGPKRGPTFAKKAPFWPKTWYREGTSPLTTLTPF